MTANRESISIIDVQSYGRDIYLVGVLQDANSCAYLKNTVCSVFSKHKEKRRLNLSEISIGSIAIGIFDIKGNNQFLPYRLQILSNLDCRKGTIFSFLVDEATFNYSTLFSCLYYCPDDLNHLPFGSEIFRLSDVLPFGSNQWKESDVKFIKSQLQNKMLRGIAFRQPNEISYFRPFSPDASDEWFATKLWSHKIALISQSFPDFGFASIKHNTHFTTDANLAVLSSTPSNSPTKSDQISSNDNNQSATQNPSYFCPIEVGFQDFCYVTLVEKGPSKFYVRFNSHHNYRTELNLELSKIKCVKGLSSCYAKMHIPVLSSDSDHTQYERGIIIGDVIGNKVPIFFVDTGRIQSVLLSNIWQLPDCLLKIPMLIVKCRLQGVPKSSNTIINDRFSEFVKGRKMSITIAKRNSDVFFDVHLELNKLPIWKLISGNIFLEQTLNTGDRIIPCCFDEPSGYLYVQLASNVSLIETLQEEIQNISPSLNCLNSFFCGQPCIALYPSDNCWYRAVVLHTSEDSVKVKFVDYGNEESKNMTSATSEIKEISPAILSCLPGQAMPCLVKALGKDAFNGDTVFDVAEENSLSVQILEIVQLEGLGFVPKINIELGPLVPMNIFNMKTTLEEPPQPVPPSPPTASDVVNEIPIVPDTLKPCQIVHIKSASHFYVQLEQNKKDREFINEVMSKKFFNSPNVHDVKLNDSVMVGEFKSGISFYRATVLSVVQDVIDVFLVDVGRQQITPKHQIKRLPMEISLNNYPGEAILCSLSESDKIFFKDFVSKFGTSKNSLQVLFLRKPEDKWMVSLLRTSNLLSENNSCSSKSVSSRTSYSRESSSEENWRKRSFNEPTFVNGSSSSGRSFAKEPSSYYNDQISLRAAKDPSVRSFTKDSFHCERDRNSARRVSSSSPAKESLFNGDRRSSLRSCDSPSHCDRTTSGKVYSSSKYDKQKDQNIVTLPSQPVLENGLVYIAFVGEVVNEVWIHRDSNCDALESLHQNIEREVSDIESVPLLSNGEHYCLGQSQEDLKWYRAKIIGKTESKVNLIYIDYGNTEEVPLSCVRSLSNSLRTVHPLAYLCKLESDTLTSFLADYNGLNEVMHMNVVRKENEIPLITLVHDGKPIKDLMVAKSAKIEQDSKIDDCQKFPQNINKDEQFTSEPFDIPFQKLPLNESCEFIVSYIEDEFIWIQLSSVASKLDELMEKIRTTVCDMKGVVSPTIGMFCLGKYSIDDHWYRVKIIGEEKSDFLVNFVDYGNSDTVNLQNLKQLPGTCRELPCQAVKSRVYVKNLDKVIDEDDIVSDGLDFMYEDNVVGSPIISSNNELVLTDCVISGDPLESKIKPYLNINIKEKDINESVDLNDKVTENGDTTAETRESEVVTSFVKSELDSVCAEYEALPVRPENQSNGEGFNCMSDSGVCEGEKFSRNNDLTDGECCNKDSLGNIKEDQDFDSSKSRLREMKSDSEMIESSVEKVVEESIPDPSDSVIHERIERDQDVQSRSPLLEKENELEIINNSSTEKQAMNSPEKCFIDSFEKIVGDEEIQSSIPHFKDEKNNPDIDNNECSAERLVENNSQEQNNTDVTGKIEMDQNSQSPHSHLGEKGNGSVPNECPAEKLLADNSPDLLEKFEEKVFHSGSHLEGEKSDSNTVDRSVIIEDNISEQTHTNVLEKTDENQDVQSVNLFLEKENESHFINESSTKKLVMDNYTSEQTNTDIFEMLKDQELVQSDSNLINKEDYSKIIVECHAEMLVKNYDLPEKTNTGTFKMPEEDRDFESHSHLVEKENDSEIIDEYSAENLVDNIPESTNTVMPKKIEDQGAQSDYRFKERKTDPDLNNDCFTEKSIESSIPGETGTVALEKSGDNQEFQLSHSIVMKNECDSDDIEECSAETLVDNSAFEQADALVNIEDLDGQSFEGYLGEKVNNLNLIPQEINDDLEELEDQEFKLSGSPLVKERCCSDLIDEFSAEKVVENKTLKQVDIDALEKTEEKDCRSEDFTVDVPEKTEDQYFQSGDTLNAPEMTEDEDFRSDDVVDAPEKTEDQDFQSEDFTLDVPEKTKDQDFQSDDAVDAPEMTEDQDFQSDEAVDAIEKTEEKGCRSEDFTVDVLEKTENQDFKSDDAFEMTEDQEFQSGDAVDVPEVTEDQDFQSGDAVDVPEMTEDQDFQSGDDVDVPEMTEDQDFQSNDAVDALEKIDDHVFKSDDAFQRTEDHDFKSGDILDDPERTKVQDCQSDNAVDAPEKTEDQDLRSEDFKPLENVKGKFSVSYEEEEMSMTFSTESFNSSLENVIDESS